MIPIALDYFGLGVPLSVAVWGPAGKKRYAHGHLWNSRHAAFAVPMRNLYTVPPWDTFVPRSIFPEDPFRWGGFTMVLCAPHDLRALVKLMGTTPFWQVVAGHGGSSELDTFLRTLLVEWPSAISKQVDRAATALLLSPPPLVVAQARGGSWFAELLAKSYRARSARALEVYHLGKACGPALFPADDRHRPVAFVDDTLGTGRTLGAACTRLGQVPDMVLTAGTTYSPARYRRLVGKNTRFFVPSLDEHPTAFRLVENCPELMGWNYDRLGRVQQVSTRLSVLLNRAILGALL